MPLQSGDTQKAIAQNLRLLVEEGRPHEQTVAIALRQARDSSPEGRKILDKARAFDREAKAHLKVQEKAERQADQLQQRIRATERTIKERSNAQRPTRDLQSKLSRLKKDHAKAQTTARKAKKRKDEARRKAHQQRQKLDQP